MSREIKPQATLSCHNVVEEYKYNYYFTKENGQETNYPFKITFIDRKFSSCRFTNSPSPEWSLEFWKYIADVEWTIQELVSKYEQENKKDTPINEGREELLKVCKGQIDLLSETTGV